MHTTVLVCNNLLYNLVYTLQTEMMRFYLRNSDLREDLKHPDEPVFACTPTLQAIDIEKMP